MADILQKLFYMHMLFTFLIKLQQKLKYFTYLQFAFENSKR
jgi:hypothetical protein